jgi:hypothetical protein
MVPKSLLLIFYGSILALLLTSCSSAVASTDPWAMTIPFQTKGLVIGLGLVLASLVGFWLSFRHRPVERLSALQSMLLLAFLIFQLRFMGLILHEGGHALYQLVRGFGVTLYVHPFAFSGYSRPMVDFSVWTHISGTAVALPAALLISLPFWKHRSLSNLPFLMLFPWVALNDGMYMLQRQGDYHNLMQVTGLPGPVLITAGAMIAGVGLILFFSLLPLVGLSPGDRKSLLVIPTAMFLWAFLSMLVAHLVVPGSPFAIKYGLAWEIVPGTNDYYMNAIMGVLFALLYLTLYHWLRPILPGGLRMEAVNLTWRNFRLPGVLFAVSLILGLMIIT